MVLLVTYDTSAETDFEGFRKILKSQNGWACINTHTWLVKTDLKPYQLRDVLSPFNPKSLVIFEAKYRQWATRGMSSDINNFLDNNTWYT